MKKLVILACFAIFSTAQAYVNKEQVDKVAKRFRALLFSGDSELVGVGIGSCEVERAPMEEAPDREPCLYVYLKTKKAKKIYTKLLDETGRLDGVLVQFTVTGEIHAAGSEETENEL